jgi:hypothetical protein
MTLVWASGFNGVTDPDVQTYIAAVEAADGQAIEGNVAYAINDFVVGCKDDGIWDAIKASCILAGARTLSGALVPLKGTAPTNFNFVAGDYNRETGLKGNGSNKYLSANRNSNEDPLNSYHLAVYLTAANSTANGHWIAAEDSGQRNSIYPNNPVQVALRSGANLPSTGISNSGLTGLIAAARTSSSSVSYSIAGNNGTVTSASVVAPDENTVVFARSLGGTVSSYNNGRFAFYSIGEAIDLEKLDTRVTRLMNLLPYALAPGLPSLSTMDTDAALYISAVYRAGGTLS